MKFWVLAITFLGLSCSNHGNDLLSSSDSLVVQFQSKDSGAVKVVATTDKKAIGKMADFTHGKQGLPHECGYDGSLLFYTKGKLVGDVSFNYSQDGCHYFLQKQGDTLNATMMKGEAVDFLKGLAEGKSWY